MTTFPVPARAEVSHANQAIFDKLNTALGFVPNLYATIAYSENALGTYLAYQGAKSSISKKDKEVINLVVSQVNDCAYCLSAHTYIGKLNGFTDEQILAIRRGEVDFNPKTAALVNLVQDITINRGRPSAAHLDAFFEAGYTRESLIDVILAVADKVVMNYVHNITQVAVDFPLAPALEASLKA